MKYTAVSHTDKGIVKDINQDSMLLMQAKSSMGEIIFAAICDGMGGLKKGEVASAEVICALANWFKNDLPYLLTEEFNPLNLKDSWKFVVERESDRISEYGLQKGFSLGTTMVTFLCIGNQYYIANVGDSRVYRVESDRLYQITHDHTLIHQEIDLGLMKPEDAKQDIRKNILTQCIGASGSVEPDFFSGTLRPGQLYLLCCDGFRHVIDQEEFCRFFDPAAMKSEAEMKRALPGVVDEIKRRGERDNISAIMIRTD